MQNLHFFKKSSYLLNDPHNTKILIIFLYMYIYIYIYTHTHTHIDKNIRPPTKMKKKKLFTIFKL